MPEPEAKPVSGTVSGTVERLRSLLPAGARPAGPLPGEEAAAPLRWSRAGLAGRVGELCAGEASAALTLACLLVGDAQREGEPVAWIAGTEEGFYPPDAAANGVDLETLAVVRVPDAPAAVRAASRLTRSGAFGLIVLDLVGYPGKARPIPAALQGRLAQQALRHGTAILGLTGQPGRVSVLGALVSLRGEATRRRAGADRFVCTLAVSKDKRNGAGWTHDEVCHGPPGLR